MNDIISHSTCVTNDRHELRSGDCYGRIEGGFFFLGNDAIRRVWRITSSGLLPVGLDIFDGDRQWLVPSPSPKTGHADVLPARLSYAERNAFITETSGLNVTLSWSGERYRFSLFHHLAVVLMRREKKAGESNASSNNNSDLHASVTAADGVESGPAHSDGPRPIEVQPYSLDRLALAPAVLSLEATRTYGRSDERFELVQSRTYAHLWGEGELRLCGNIFAFEEPVSGDGLVYLRHGLDAGSAYGPRAGRPDFLSRHNVVEWLDEPSIPLDDGYVASDWHTLVAYRGGHIGRVQAMHAYEKQLRPPRSTDRVMLSNTWGDRGQDGRVNEAFVIGEIQAAAALGVDVVQIDDGWQAGRTSNSTESGGRWSGFWDRPGFWLPHADRFPRGLSPVIKAARTHGVSIGLWYAPDSTNDFACWEKDAAQLLELHRQYGVAWFKLDAVMIESGKAQANFDRLLDKVLSESGGRITLDLDATAGLRLDYLGRPDVGPVFVENRYTDWGSYFPHLTLRTLWSLAQWFEPSRLRMEWLNPDRYPEMYGESELAPSRYSADYLFASVMVAAPLAWMELQQLTEKQQREVTPLIAKWRGTREAWVGASVVPIGSQPDGRSWTGFEIRPESTRSYQLIVFREAGAGPAYRYQWPDPAAARTVSVVHASGSFYSAQTESGIDLRLDHARSFVWLNVEVAG